MRLVPMVCPLSLSLCVCVLFLLCSPFLHLAQERIRDLLLGVLEERMDIHLCASWIDVLLWTVLFSLSVSLVKLVSFYCLC